MGVTFSKFEIHGHRGFRGKFPENTLLAFQEAVALGVDAVEFDILPCATGELLLSHEPYMRSAFCLLPNGGEIAEQDEKKHNIYKMPLAEVQTYDCGLKLNLEFPEQLKTKAYKPSFQEVVDAVGFPSNFKYNIEIKSEKEFYGTYQPYPAEFARNVYDFARRNDMLDRAYFQSFDPQILVELRKLDSNLCLSYLDEIPGSFLEKFEKLGFLPQVYAPWYGFIDENMISFAKENNIKVIPWTVNDREDMLRLKRLGVDGLISDFPDRGMDLREK